MCVILQQGAMGIFECGVELHAVMLSIPLYHHFKNKVVRQYMSVEL